MALPIKVSYATDAESLNALIRKLENVELSVEKRAREVFIQRGCTCGHPVDDWYMAERELYNVPAAEMKETEKGIEIRVAIPGCRAEQLEIIALPGILAIEDRPSVEKMHGRTTERLVSSAMNERPLFRRFSPKHPIDPKAVRATLSDGMLTITASRAAPMTEAERLALEARMLIPKRVS